MSEDSKEDLRHYFFVVSVPSVLHGILDRWYEAPIARQGQRLHVPLHMHHLSQETQIGSHVAINICDESVGFDLASCSQLQVLDNVMDLALCFESIIVTKMHQSCLQAPSFAVAC